MTPLKPLLAAALATLSATIAFAQPAGLDVPVRAGEDASEFDACAGFATVTGLDPKGDDFLSVRSGPGGRAYREVDRVHTGQRLAICEERGPWLGVVYATEAKQDCGVATPWPRRAVYAGPCRSGWVHRRYVTVKAG